MIKDLTKGNSLKVLVMFALPMILSVTLQQLYNICDSAIAGRILGTNALSSINASYPMVMIYLGVATGCGVGSGVICSRLFGQKNYRELKSAISTALISLLVIAIFVTIIGLIFNTQIIHLLRTPDEIFDDAKKYLFVYVLGLLFTFLYNVCGFIFQSIGNSKLPLYFLILSTILNIILDIVLLKCFNLGIIGLALATIIAQAICSILSLLFLINQVKKFESEKFDCFKFDLLKKISIIAIPSVIQSSIISIGQLFVQSLINSYGANVIAAYGSAFKINMLFVNIFTAISNAISNFTSQNIGAKQLNRLKEGLRAGLIINLVVVLIGVLVCNLLSEQLIKIFLDPKDINLEVLEIGKGFLNIVTPFFLFVAVKISYDGVIKGSSDMVAFMTGTMVDLILRIAFAYILAHLLNSYIGIWWSWPIGWLVGAIISIIFYYTGHYKKKLTN